MRAVLYGVAGLGLLTAVFFWRTRGISSTSEVPFEAQSKPPEAAALCPWRSPEADLLLFFPEATRHETETRILSGRRLELQKALGRAPAPDEIALHLHRVYRGWELLGTVLTRRAKGEFGGIEFVLAVDRGGLVLGVRLQRQREIEAVASALENPTWLKSFAGKTARDAWKLGSDIASVAPAAEASARALLEGVRSLLVMLALAEQAESPAKATHHH